MDNYRRLLSASMQSDDALRKELAEVLEVIGLTVQEFSRRAGVSPSTIYKIVNEDRAPSLDVLRRILSAVREADGRKAGKFIAVIAARHVLEEVVERSVQIGTGSVRVREYPASTVEDAIVAAIRAERDGAIAVVCAPIVSYTIEKVVDIPIATIMPRDSVTEAIRLAARKSKN
ncbi:MAG: helix-turn-helix domain-containing protein [Thermoplasmata archaeon]|nr:helix-turn-helix domain-containing protein [Thermoplasmata archaeon]MCJ7562679.1 helix-turn-helix domain-containing protein [Thermoplasmata archaeon]TFG69957.1 MAG: helix-turn-helix domain-containing protein [Methanomassiliicoccus sp.]